MKYINNALFVALNCIISGSLVHAADVPTASTPEPDLKSTAISSTSKQEPDHNDIIAQLNTKYVENKSPHVAKAVTYDLTIKSALSKQTLSIDQKITLLSQALNLVLSKNLDTDIIDLITYMLAKEAIKGNFDTIKAKITQKGPIALPSFTAHYNELKKQPHREPTKVILPKGQAVTIFIKKDTINDEKRLQGNKLDLSNLGLTSLQGLSDLDGIKDVEYLYAQNNKIRRVEPEIFILLPKLQAVHLGHNEISRLENPDLFKEATNLKTLALNNNKLVWLPKNIFKRLENLEALILDHNKLTYFNPNLIAQNKKLKHINLQNNNLADIAVDRFGVTHLPDLAFLYLQNNPLNTNGLAELKELKTKRPETFILP